MEASATFTEKRSGGMEFEDIQDIQVLQDKLEVFQHALNADLHILTRLPRQLVTSSIGDFEDLENLACSELSRLVSLLKRLSATTDLVRTITFG